MFIAEMNFLDKESNHDYKKGDIFPFENVEVDSKRLEELSTKKNRLKKVIIKEKLIEELNERQLVQAAKVKGIDVRQLLINELKEKNNSDNVASVSNSGENEGSTTPDENENDSNPGENEGNTTPDEEENDSNSEGKNVNIKKSKYFKKNRG